MQMPNEMARYLTPLSLKLQHWWQERAPREQQVLRLLGVMLVVFLVYALIWQPVMQARSEARARYLSAHQTYDWMQANAAAIHAARKQDGASPSGASDWVMNINQSAAAAGLALKGFTPEGSDSVRVVLEKQPFATVLAWFETLKKSDAVVPASVQISATSDAGLVNVQVTLTGSN